MDPSDDKNHFKQLMTTCPAMILAGGRGLRLGARDKALCHLGETTLLAHCLERLGRQCAPLAVNANGDLDRFASFSAPVVPDSLEGHLGPLAGVLAAMDWAASLGHHDVITVAVDTPFFPRDLADRFVSERQPNKIALAGTCGADGKLWAHPIFGIWPVGLRDQLRADLLAGARKVMRWADAQGATTIAFEAEHFDPFFNINTPEDLRQAEQIKMQAL